MATKAPATKTATRSAAAKSKSAVQQLISQLAASVTRQVLPDIVYDKMDVYARTTVEQRAIPDYRDGLKPVQRRNLWSMYKLGIGHGSNAATVKCARVTGDVMGKYHPHGDAAIYDALANMTFGHDPLVFGQGNLGLYDGSPPAASRYTECRLMPLSAYALLDPAYIAVSEMLPNYDYKEEEPLILPAKLPMGLVRGASGMAVGAVTGIPSFTAKSVAGLVKKAAAKAVKTKAKRVETSAKQAFKTLEMASEYGGTMISSDEDVKTVLKTGFGPITWMCDYTFDPKTNTYTITGFPPSNFFSYIATVKRLNAMDSVSAVQDLTSDKTGIKVQVVLMKGQTRASTEAAFKKIVTCTFHVKCNVTMRRVVEDRGLRSSRADFASMSPVDMVNNWFIWRLDLEKRVQQKKIDDWTQAIAKEELLLKAIINLKTIFDLLQKKGIDKVAELSKALKISVDDSKYIWSVAVGRLDKLNEADIKAKIAGLKDNIKQAKVIIATPALAVVEDMKTLEKMVN